MTSPTVGPRFAGAVAALTWLATAAALQWSVVRFRVLIMLVLTMAAAVLALALWRRVTPDPAGRWLSVALLGSAVVTPVVPLFSYLRGNWRTAAVVIVVVAALGCAALTWLAGRALTFRPYAVATAAIAILLAIGLPVVAIVGDPAPRIDVWVMLQQSSDLLARGENFYTATWTGSPGVQDLYSYLPWATVLLGPGKWLAGDVRWALLVWNLVLFAGVLTLARSGRDAISADAADAADKPLLRGASVIALLAVVPGVITQVDQAWTEPLLAALLTWWAVLVARGRAWWAIVPLALACATKQHLALVVPLLMVWQAFGWRRVLATGGLVAALISPWMIADIGAFWHDTVTALVQFHPIRFANTWYLFFLNEFGVALPFWVTGIVVLGTLAIAVWQVHRRQPDLGELLRWVALVLLAANLVNKQAFYNQFWLSLALVAVSLVVRRSRRVAPDATATG